MTLPSQLSAALEDSNKVGDGEERFSAAAPPPSPLVPVPGARTVSSIPTLGKRRFLLALSPLRDPFLLYSAIYSTLALQPSSVDRLDRPVSFPLPSIG